MSGLAIIAMVVISLAIILGLGIWLSSKSGTYSTKIISSPAPSAKSYGWVWPAVIGLGLLAIVYFTIPALRTATPPQAPAVKKEVYHKPQPYRASVDLIEEKSIGVVVEQKDFSGKPTEFVIRSNGKALMFVDIFNIPQHSTVYIRAYITRYYPGEMILAVNGTIFTSLHRGGGKQWTVFPIAVSNFHGGTNSIVLSSPGEDIVVLSPNIEIE